jgi:peptidoglycan hydrolase CwlO-like protein
MKEEIQRLISSIQTKMKQRDDLTKTEMNLEADIDHIQRDLDEIQKNIIDIEAEIQEDEIELLALIKEQQ